MNQHHQRPLAPGDVVNFDPAGVGVAFREFFLGRRRQGGAGTNPTAKQLAVRIGDAPGAVRQWAIYPMKFYPVREEPIQLVNPCHFSYFTPQWQALAEQAVVTTVGQRAEEIWGTRKRGQGTRKRGQRNLRARGGYADPFVFAGHCHITAPAPSTTAPAPFRSRLANASSNSYYPWLVSSSNMLVSGVRSDRSMPNSAASASPCCSICSSQ